MLSENKDRILIISIGLAIIILIVLSHVFLLKGINKNTTKFSEINETLFESESKFSEWVEDIKGNNESYSEAIKTEINELNEGIGKIYGEAQSIKKKIDFIAAELEKKSGERAGNDEAYLTFVKDGNKFFEKKNYSASAKSFSDALHLYGGDDTVRMKMVLSMYYQNPMDRKNYKPILEELDVLKRNGFHDSRLDEVEMRIKKELGND